MISTTNADHAKIADRNEPKRCCDAKCCNDHTRKRWAYGAADIYPDAVGGDRRAKILLRNQLRHDGLPRGRLQSLHGADQECEQQQRPRGCPVGGDQYRKQSGNKGDQDFEDEDESAFVNNVRQRAGGQGKKEHWQAGCDLHQRDHKRACIKTRHHPAGGRVINPTSDIGDDRSDPQPSEHGVTKWTPCRTGRFSVQDLLGRISHRFHSRCPNEIRRAE